MWHENLSALIYDWRELNKMSQAELAEKLGYGSSQFISNIERGLCGFPISKLKKLCKILKIDERMMLEALVADFTEEIQRDGFGKKSK